MLFVADGATRVWLHNPKLVCSPGLQPEQTWQSLLFRPARSSPPRAAHSRVLPAAKVATVMVSFVARSAWHRALSRIPGFGSVQMISNDWRP